MTNAMSDDRERLLNGDWIVYNFAENENFDLTASKIAILTEKQREQMYFNNDEPERLRDLETYDLHTLVMWRSTKASWWRIAPDTQAHSERYSL